MFLVGFEGLPPLGVIRPIDSADSDARTSVLNRVDRIGADIVQVIEGSRCRTSDALFIEWTSGLQLPSAAHSWTVFADCMRGWPEIGSEVLVLQLDTHEVLADATDADRTGFWDIVSNLEPDRPEAHIRLLFCVPRDVPGPPAVLRALPEVRA